MRIDKGWKYLTLRWMLKLFFPDRAVAHVAAAYTNASKHIDMMYDIFNIDIRIEKCSDDPLMEKVCQLLEAERESLMQKYRRDFQFLRYITERKGGLAGQVLLLMVDRDASREMLDLFHDLGYIAQLVEDYIDVPVDILEGVHTLFTERYYTYSDIVREYEEAYRKHRDLIPRHVDAAVRRVLKAVRFRNIYRTVIGTLGALHPINLLTLIYIAQLFTPKNTT